MTTIGQQFTIPVMDRDRQTAAHDALGGIAGAERLTGFRIKTQRFHGRMIGLQIG